jgi:hypothetical protein
MRREKGKREKREEEKTGDGRQNELRGPLAA